MINTLFLHKQLRFNLLWVNYWISPTLLHNFNQHPPLYNCRIMRLLSEFASFTPNCVLDRMWNIQYSTFCLLLFNINVQYHLTLCFCYRKHHYAEILNLKNTENDLTFEITIYRTNSAPSLTNPCATDMHYSFYAYSLTNARLKAWHNFRHL